MSIYVEPSEQTPFDVDSLVAACIESGAGSLLLDSECIPSEFFDLSTRVAGELLHGLSKYSLRLAAVVPDLTAHSSSFQDFARESHGGRQVRFFRSRADAIEWLSSSVPR